VQFRVAKSFRPFSEGGLRSYQGSGSPCQLSGRQNRPGFAAPLPHLRCAPVLDRYSKKLLRTAPLPLNSSQTHVGYHAFSTHLASFFPRSARHLDQGSQCQRILVVPMAAFDQNFGVGLFEHGSALTIPPYPFDPFPARFSSTLDPPSLHLGGGLEPV